MMMGKFFAFLRSRLLELRMIADGVETNEQMALIAGLGCDAIFRMNFMFW